MTYVAQENPGGIKYMISDKINHFDDYHAEQIDGVKTAAARHRTCGNALVRTSGW